MSKANLKRSFLLRNFVRASGSFLFNLRALWLLSPGPPTTRHCARVSLGALAAMIGKMADEKEFEEKTGSSESEGEEDDEEDNVPNGRDDVDEDESEYDDPEGFVDDITDEGNFIIQHIG